MSPLQSWALLIGTFAVLIIMLVVITLLVQLGAMAMSELRYRRATRRRAPFNQAHDANLTKRKGTDK